jgi:hypothetical protein
MLVGLIISVVGHFRKCRDVQLESAMRAKADAPLAGSIVEVGGVPETAQILGIAETTVKTHLHRVFSKTGTNCQADLVKLAAGFSNPLMN